MKNNKILMSLLLGLSVVACAPKAEEATGAAEGEGAEVVEAPVQQTAKDFKISKAELDSVSYLVGINFGSFVKGYNFGDLNTSQMLKGMKDFINAKGNQRDENFEEQFKIAPSKMNELFNSYLEKRHNILLLENKEKEEKFLAANAKKAGVQVTESGLQYIIEEAGNDVKPGPRDTVWVNYKGTLLDGTVFDENNDVHFTLNRVVPGWTEGMQLIGEGGKIKLMVPSNLGYGERGNQGIEPNATLLFDVELLKVGKFVPATPAE